MGRGWERVLTTSCTVTADGLVTIDDQATSDDTSAPDLPHPLQLGLARPLADYIPEYGLDAALERVPYDAEFEPVALKEIRKVCKLGGEADVIIMQDADRVTISTLNTILKLSQSPLYLRHFESTPLISGCIKLMASVAIPNNSSLFSYEYGYLCFKVLTIAIGVCLLARSHKLTPVIEQMMADQNTPMLQLFSIEVSQLVKEEIEDADNNTIACDWLLGWAKAPERAQEPPLASRYDIITLSKILFDDCKSFMKAWSSTFSPGLSGVVFLLWRYVHNKCIVNTSPRPEAKLIPLCEIIWRCMIMATKDEVIPLMYMFNTVQSAGVRMWEKHCRTPAGRSDVEDFRTILELFLMRLAPTNPERYSKFGFAEMAAVIPFVAGRVRGCEDLFPKLFKMAFDRAIEAHDIQEFDDINLICATGGTLVYLGNCLQMVENSLPYKPEILMQLVTILAENKVFELVARTVVILKQTITLGDDAECYEAV
ncbi:unnamed protein product [Rhizoctonia solani]|uniref:Uncharacterized protein n=1 Tax=Rhizoctonia solani TaxID=456999 RepID=A0A8H3E1P2_9AGAM|nr:unnamed protein product [Rhizoctonia solani]